MDKRNGGKKRGVKKTVAKFLCTCLTILCRLNLFLAMLFRYTC